MPAAPAMPIWHSGAPGPGPTGPPAPSGGGGFVKVLAVVGSLTVVGLLGFIGYMALSGDNRQADPPTVETTDPTEQDTTDPDTDEPETTDSSETDPTEPFDEDSSLTEGQQQAAAAARLTISDRPYSREGLITYLTTDRSDGTFPRDDAEVAVDSLGVDWDLQATMRAEEYLDSSAFSKKGLIDQLEYHEFTSEQATQAVDGLDVDWAVQAKHEAEQYAKYLNTSRSRILGMMTDIDLYEVEQAEQGLNAANIDWNAEAADAAAEQLEYYKDEGLTCDELIGKLSGEYSEEFTVEQAEYGAGTTDAC